jgi:hypothetical protein
MFFEKTGNNLLSISVAGAEGFEPSVTDPKSVALPLGYAPMQLYFIDKRRDVKW